MFFEVASDESMINPYSKMLEGKNWEGSWSIGRNKLVVVGSGMMICLDVKNFLAGKVMVF